MFRLTKTLLSIFSVSRLVYALVVSAAMAGGATYIALTSSPKLGGNPSTVTALLTIDLLILLLLGGVVITRIWRILAERRRGQAGAKLHVRLASMFGLIAILPAIFMVTFSVLFLHSSIQSWFNEQIKTSVTQAQNVAQAYLQEHEQVLRTDAIAMAADINREAGRLSFDQQRLEQVVLTQANLRGLSEVMVLEGTGKILARAGYTFTLELEPIPETMLERARQGEIVLYADRNDNRVRSLLRIDALPNSFLYIGRLVDPKVISYIKTTDEAVQAYNELDGRRATLQITMTSIYGVVALLLMLVAVWYGLNFTNRLVNPIGALIRAANRLKNGDFTARTHDADSDDEIGLLGRAFNDMAGQLQSHRKDLIDANRTIDLRRRFTETVLEGVSAGVLGLDARGTVNLSNASASRLLGLPENYTLVGRNIAEFMPELGTVISTEKNEGITERQLQVKDYGGEIKTFLVRISTDLEEDERAGHVVTFDDISDLVDAQRKAAWADVARRIAHEIKNPLTPIQLSAERLRRKYLKKLDGDQEVFQQCLDTIIRQVEDIRRMTDEFSAFARMPKPVLKPENLTELVKQVVFLHSTANSDIEFNVKSGGVPVHAVCDGRQIFQAMTNLLQNAVDAVNEARRGTADGKYNGKININLLENNDDVVLSVQDNGMGLPEKEREKLTDPYVTTKEKGTGLGLAIVKKIMEDHGGKLRLLDGENGGAVVALHLPRQPVGQ